MIEFDESEYSLSPVTDITLQFIEEIYGPEVKDKLLYRVMNNDMGPNPVSIL